MVCEHHKFTMSTMRKWSISQLLLPSRVHYRPLQSRLIVTCKRRVKRWFWAWSILQSSIGKPIQALCQQHQIWLWVQVSFSQWGLLWILGIPTSRKITLCLQLEVEGVSFISLMRKWNFPPGAHGEIFGLHDFATTPTLVWVSLSIRIPFPVVELCTKLGINFSLG